MNKIKRLTSTLDFPRKKQKIELFVNLEIERSKIVCAGLLSSQMVLPLPFEVEPDSLGIVTNRVVIKKTQNKCIICNKHCKYGEQK